jgi:type IV pilus assembly protein PilY1
MRRFHKSLLVTSAALVAGLSGGSALAQSDINPPLPNVMLLVDTSGSMENMANDKPPEDKINNPGAACSPGVATPANKWATLVQVLTGDINNFSCEALDRTQANFKKEYALPPYGGATPPYDADYYLPHHRLLSNGCGPAPGDWPTNWYDWPANPIKFHASNYGSSCNTWSQQANGIVDTFKDQIRFGLATFDTLPNSGTGASGNSPSPSTGAAGMWSYFLNWNNGGMPAQGRPPNCTLSDQEVGFRNEAAPPWEGRLLAFGDPLASVQDMIAANTRVEQELIAMRPFGATPLVGMLSDTKDFLFSDVMNNPATGQPFGPNGPNGDPYWKAGCRKTFVILLSDGAPNLDLMPSCNGLGNPPGPGTNGICPYGPNKYAWDYAYDLAHPQGYPNQPVQVFTVAFGLSKAKDNRVSPPAAVDCKTLKASDLNPGGLCDSPTDDALRACCTMLRIARQGYPGAAPNCLTPDACGAYYADDKANLKAALAAILSQIAVSATSRTMPVNVAGGAVNVGLAGAGNAGAVSYQFLAGFTPAVGSSLWLGNLVRKRWVCDANLNASVANIDKTVGDDFAANLDSLSGPTRQLWTFIANPDGAGIIQSSRSIRPKLGVDDGLGLYSGTQTALLAPDNFASTVGGWPGAFGIAPNTPTCVSLFGSGDAVQCATKVTGWNVGAAIMPTRTQAGCPVGKTCSLLGAIYHSTPALSGPPRDFVRDESYSWFAAGYTTPAQGGHTQKVQTRPLTLYTATTDGQLHSFVVGVNEVGYTPNAGPGGPSRNELFSFMPPAVLPTLLSAYGTQATLLDGPPVIRDVVFSRSKALALGSPQATTWNTVLVGSSGQSPNGGFYYALDITDPKAPQFLWQLSTDAAGVRMFGDAVPQPAIATLQVKDGAEVNEVAVAILAGGSAQSQNAACKRDGSDSVKNANNANVATPPRAAVRCWGQANAINPSRSITIVRLSDGKVLMSMRGRSMVNGVATDDGPSFGAVASKKYVGFDSPMVGTPVPFPSGTGTLANRVYVGDADGTLWRLDVSSPDPTQWTAGIAWDGHTLLGDGSLTGQPIATPPILSVDSFGNTVILFSTGDQQLFTSTSGVQTRVWSILEKPVAMTPPPPSGAVYKTSENWHIDLTQAQWAGGAGARVVGPMSLFNSIAYFSVFVPNQAGAPVCDPAAGDGTGYIWAVDYVRDDSPTGLTSKNPLQRWDTNAATKPYWTDPALKGATPFGVAVTQTPSCLSTQSSSDAFVGTHTTVSGASNASYSLVIQTGAKGGAKQNNAPLNTFNKTLATPKRMTKMDSWAGVVE